MRQIKLDNEECDLRAIVIHGDFTASSDGEFFKLKYANEIFLSESLGIFSAESFRWHLAIAQEEVDDIIYRMINNEYYR